MIYLLEELTQAGSDVVGQEVAKLYNLSKSNVRLVSTLILTTDSFRYFAERGSIDEEQIERILSAVKEDAFSGSPSCFLQISLAQKCNGILNNITCEKDYYSIKYAVERIYRSWFDERARAFRVTHSINDEESVPAIFIEPFYDELFSLVSRTPVEGERTNENNYRFNIHNKLNSFSPSFKVILEAVERAVKRPSKIYFTADARICKVKDQMMTEAALWHFLDEYLEGGLISKLEYLKSIKPHMISQYVGYRYEAPEGKTLSAGAIPGAPGVAKGHLVFTTSSLDKIKSQESILAVADFSPDDLEVLQACRGALQTRGGVTSHLAVICRGMSKPAVVGARNIEIDLFNKVLHYSGITVPEFTNVVLDGTAGNIIFGGNAIRKDTYGLNETIKPHLLRFIEVLNSFNHISVFSKLPIDVQIDVQTHIASLKHQLRNVGLIT